MEVPSYMRCSRGKGQQPPGSSQLDDTRDEPDGLFRISGSSQEASRTQSNANACLYPPLFKTMPAPLSCYSRLPLTYLRYPLAILLPNKLPAFFWQEGRTGDQLLGWKSCQSIGLAYSARGGDSRIPRGFAALLHLCGLAKSTLLVSSSFLRWITPQPACRPDTAGEAT